MTSSRSIPIQTYYCSLTDTQWPVWLDGHGGEFVSEGQSYVLQQPTIPLPFKRVAIGTRNKGELDIPKGTQRFRVKVLKQPSAPKHIKMLFKVYVDEEKVVRTVVHVDEHTPTHKHEAQAIEIATSEVRGRPGWRHYTYETALPAEGKKKLGFELALLDAEDPLERKENKVTFNELQVDLVGGTNEILRFHPEMRINEPFWACTHNAFANFEDKWNFANQSVNITSQLRVGVRCFMLDIYESNNTCVLRHVIQTPDERRLRDTLKEMRTFLDKNPDEILMIIFEDHLEKADSTKAKVYKEFAESNTESEIFLIHKPNTSVVNGVTHKWDIEKDGWPTVSTLVRMRKRIIVFTDNRKSGFPWQWDHMVENVFGNDSITPEKWVNERDSSADVRKRSPNHKRTFLLMNHFGALNVVAGVAEDTPFFRSKSYKENDGELIARHMKDYEKAFGQPPNIVAVDFADVGHNGGVWAALRPYIEAKWKEVSQRKK